MSKTIKHYKKYKEKKENQKNIEKRIEKINKDYEKRLKKYISAIEEKKFWEAKKKKGSINHTYAKSIQIGLKRKTNKITKKVEKISRNKQAGYKSLNSLKKSLYSLVQLYARLRDSDMYGYGKCISCNKKVHYKNADGGHYISRIYMISAFDENNIHLQCKTCNKPGILGGKNGNIKEYRPKLVEKIGIGKVIKLENDKNMIKNRSITELEKLIKYYQNKNKTLKKEKKG